MEKRSEKRISGRLPAIIKSGGNTQSVEVRDCCSGGMFIALSMDNAFGLAGTSNSIQPRKGMQIQIQIELLTGFDQQVISFGFEILRLDQYGFGGRFLNAEPSKVQRLLESIKREPAKEVSSVDLSDQLSSMEKMEIIDCCNDVVEKCFDITFKGYFRDIHKLLFDTASEEKSVQGQNDLFDAQAALIKIRDTFPKNYMDSLHAIWQQGPTDIRTLTKTAEKKPVLSMMSLIENDKLDEWLAFQDMCNKAEVAYNLPINEMNARLSRVYGTDLSKEDNPFAPAIFAYNFQKCLTEIGLPSKALQICFSLFKESLFECYEGVIVQINDLLVHRGVLPNVEVGYEIKNLVSSNRQSFLDKPRKVDKPAEDDYMNVSLPAKGLEKLKGLKTEQWMSLLDNLEGVHDQVSLDHVGSGSGNSGGANVNGNSATAGGHVAGGADQNEGNKKRHFFSRLASKVADKVSQSRQELSKKEIFNVLSNVRASEFDENISDNQFMEHVADKIKESIANVDGEKFIPATEVKVLDVTSQIYSSLSLDDLVADNVKPWLRKLAVPMMKIALQDKTFFTDREHVARQLVNNISKLEFYGKDDHNSLFFGVRSKVDALLEKLEAEEMPTVRSINTTLDVVKNLVALQDKAYQQNVEDVVAECESLFKNNKLCLVNGIDDDALGLKPGEKDSPEMLQWMKKVKRLVVDDVIIFNQDGGENKRLCLAWVASNQNFFAFVNKKGQKERVCSVLSLAASFKSGDVLVPQNTDEFALDRAQFSMLENLHKKVIHDSSYDQLTGLLNRRALQRSLQEKLFSLSSCTVFLCGFEQYEPINNAFGEKAGEKLVLDISELFKQVCGDKAAIGKVSESAFGIVYPFDYERASRELDTLYKEIKQYRFKWQDKSLGISMYVGVVETTPAETVEDIMKNAASASSLARVKGANSYHLYAEHDSELIKQRQYLEWASQIDKIINEGRLVLRCQYIYPLCSDGAKKPNMEMLLGILDDQGKLLQFNGFIAAAEHYKRMVDVDRWVVSSVFKAMVEHADKFEEVGTVAINLSSSALDDDGFIDFVLEQADESGVSMNKVCFEISKTAEIHHLSNASEFINRFKQSGCSFSLDDFGSGKSSYAHLKNLPVDYLKIDGSFVKDVDKGLSDFAVVRSIVEMAHFMGKEVVAESVETEPVLARLAELNVDFSQGFLNGQPLLLSEVLAGVDEL